MAVSEPSGGVYDLNSSDNPVVWDCKNNEVANDGFIYAKIDGIRYALKDGEATVVVQTKTVNADVLIPLSVKYKGKEYNVTKIGADMCWYFTGLNSLTIPDSVTSIDYTAFYRFNGFSTHIEHITCSSFVASNSKNSHKYSKTVVITTGESIPARTFENCVSLEEITIPDSVTLIGEYAFYNCTSLKSINFMGTRAQWKAIEKGQYWNLYTGKYTVHCIDDGDI